MWNTVACSPGFRARKVDPHLKFSGVPKDHFPCLRNRLYFILIEFSILTSTAKVVQQIITGGGAGMVAAARKSTNSVDHYNQIR